MSLCPVCQTEIQDAFGLVQCPSCKTMLVAEFDGSLKLQSEELSNEDSAISVDKNEPAQELTNEQQVQESVPWDLGTPDSEPVALSKPSPEPESPILQELKEIQSFGESDDSKLSEGELVYNLCFKNVVTQDLKSEILEELKDKRFMIQQENIDVQGVQIIVKGLNPVKLSVIVTKLKHLPVEISWSQNSLTL